MNKIIITADIHLACYTQYNLFGDPKFRDKQFIRFANRLIEVAKENESKILIIAGDIIERPLISSEEQHLLFDFIDVLSKYFDDIYYINGNHDLAHRQDCVEYIDSVVNIFDRFGKMHYMHNKTKSILNKNFYFRDYIHGDIPPCPNGTDVFISHITIGGGPLKGQKFLDKNSFKICIAGDIHKPVESGNVYSVGCPLQKNLNDPVNGTIGVLDVDSLEYVRVPVATSENKFLRIFRSGEEYDVDDFTQIVTRVEKMNSITIDDGVGKKLQVSINNINDLIDKSVGNYIDIHSKFKLNVPILDPVDLNFDLKKIVIRNFKSIKNFDFNFTENKGAKRVYGKNGSGKSAIISAIKVALIGDKRIKSFQKADETDDKLFLEVELEYQNVLYKIERTIGKTQFYINGVKSNGSGKKDTENLILKSLPFLSYIDLFFLSHSNKFFDRFKESKLIDNLFGLDSLVGFLSSAEEEILAKKRELKTIEESISRHEGAIELLNNEIKETKALIVKNDVSEDEYKKSLDNTNSIQNKVELINVAKGNLQYQENLSKNKINPYKKCDDINSVITRGKILKESLEAKESISNLEQKITNTKALIESSKIKCHKCGSVQNQVEVDRIQKRLEEIESQLKQVVDPLSDLDEKTISDEIVKLRKVYEEDVNYKMFESNISSSEGMIQDLKESIEKHSKDLNLLLEGFSIDEKLKNNSNIMNSYINKKTLLQTLSRQSDKINDMDRMLNEEKIKKSNINVYISRLFEYKRLFDRESESSIYKKIIKVISDALSDDEIKFYPEDGDLIFTIKVGNLWIDFDNASEGQKSLMDLLLLQKMTQLIPNIGLLVFDEVGASLDSSKWSRLSQIMSEFNPNDMFVISHSELFAGIGRGIEVELENNTSVFSIV